MNKVKLFAGLFFLTASSHSRTGDDRFGFCTHFGLDWYVDSAMPVIASTGISYIRDDLSWAECEKVKGVYSLGVRDAYWLDKAAANGLKVVAILNSNPIYADKWDPNAAQLSVLG